MKKIFTALLLIISTIELYSQKKEIPFDESIFYHTIKINTLQIKDGKQIQGSGTGFFFQFDSTENSALPVIVTNKHVIKGASIGQLTFIRANKFGAPDTSVCTITLDNFQNRWINHPDTNVDLCVLPLLPILIEAKKKNFDLIYFAIPRKFLLSKSKMKELKALENIKVVGYPNGLADNFNHLPIVRTGTTATPPYYDYEGKKIFLIDCPSFPGSSGSPVMVYDIGNTTDKNGMISYQTKIYLLGVLFASSYMDFKGEIQLQNIPTATYVNTGIPINIGLVIKAEELLEFEKLLKK